MTDRPITRRNLLKGGAALAGAMALGGFRGVDAFAPNEEPALVVFWLNGGPAGFFNSANSFLASGAFGVTDKNVRALGNGLYVDAGSLGALPAPALTHIASINFRHGILRPHEQARAAVLESGSHSQLLRVAAAMPDAPIRCALVNSLGFPAGISASPATEGTASIKRVLKFSEISRLTPRDYSQVCAAYGAGQSATDINDQRTTFSAVELLVRAGTKVIFAQPAYTGRTDRQFDTHNDDTGVLARQVMGPITPSLSLFLDRALSLPNRNVVTVLVGEFSRTIPESDHEPGGTATVIGKYIKTGTAGPQRADGAPPENAPPPEGLWAYVCAALHLGATPFGRNPNPELIV
ncbi:MAG TPA: twin-arginine translocation signal domain-containing protein [Blastocatellia bacterium]|nr:twin-arginine translocation signal domain-containing protein [Blastocatellia bacterium]